MELRPSEYWAIEKVKFSKHCRAIQHLWEEGKSSPVGLPPARVASQGGEEQSVQLGSESLGRHLLVPSSLGRLVGGTVGGG